MTALPPASSPLVIDIDRPIRTGILAVVVGFFGFLLWASFAPITSAAVAPGVVVADSRNKDIQHLEGGIVHEVLVREGDRVSAGQVLVRLDSAQANANLGRLEATRSAALAAQARLIAERDGSDHIAFPDELTRATDAEAIETLKGQQALFDSDRQAQTSEIGILTQRVAQYQEEITGIDAQVAAENEQIALTAQETASVQGLVDKGLATKTRLLALQRTAAGLGGQRGENLAQIARAKQNIAEMQERLVNTKAQRIQQTVTDLRDAEAKLTDLNQQITAAADASRRLDVKAPVAGKIIRVFAATPGGVVRPGDTIMQLLPDQDQLVIEAQVRPTDIDSVAPGQKARVRLSAYSQRRTSSLRGKVLEVSADRIVDPHTDKAYFLARVLVDASSLAAQKSLRLYPGMPAVVYIEKGRHSMLDYLLTPLFNGIETGLHEQ